MVLGSTTVMFGVTKVVFIVLGIFVVVTVERATVVWFIVGVTAVDVGIVVKFNFGNVTGSFFVVDWVVSVATLITFGDVDVVSNNSLSLLVDVISESVDSPKKMIIHEDYPKI